ncbi:mipc synthase [Colletotrichum truncatum]|uniref:Mipc synthase n=1 Tax=Colletotrichum truncatum TaxID=5467 RepID=A0ACC3YJ93_COLTU|nr:mipc synthase [Colletotrichum truncatum]KAF6797217.1 mipc synthase [Colletotrichum truncatum]
MVSLPRGSCLKLSVVAIVSITAVVVLHQLSYTNTNDFSLLSQPIQVLNECPVSPEGEGDLIAKTIPKTIHQIWKTADVSTYPATPSHDNWKAAFEPKNYTVKLWTDADILDLIKKNYTWLLSTYEGYDQNIQRADLARLVVIHAEGGTYADLDVHPRDGEAIMCLQRHGLQGAFGPTGGSTGLSNHFFMAEKNSDFLKWALQEAKRRGGSSSKRILLPYLRVFWSTGPLMLTAAFQQYSWMYGTLAPQVVLLSENYVGTMIAHAAGRSWHGSDGQVLNYISDHVQLNGIWVAVSCLAVLVFFCIMRRYRADLSYRTCCKNRHFEV